MKIQKPQKRKISKAKKFSFPILNLMKVSKEPVNQLKYVLPWSFIMPPGVCLLKNGALMSVYQVEYPDLESSSANSIASMASLVNNSVMSLASQEGWALFFDVKRYKTKAYPAGEFDNLLGWLVDRRRGDNYKEKGEHFTSDYYITFVYQLPSDIEEKSTGIFFKSDKKPLANASNGIKAIEEMKKEVAVFVDEVEKVMGTLATKIWCHRLDDSELFSYIKSTVSTVKQKMFMPKGVFFFLDNYICDTDIETSMPLLPKGNDDFSSGSTGSTEKSSVYKVIIICLLYQ